MGDERFPSIQKFELPTSVPELLDAYTQAITHDEGCISNPWNLEGITQEQWVEKSKYWAGEDKDIIF